MNRICMHMPSASGGHPKYVHELMQAMARLSGNEWALELVSSVDLDPQFDSPLYPAHRVMPQLFEKSTFPNRLAWIINRSLHYPRTQRAFLEWIRSRPDIGIIHFQEFNARLPGLLRKLRAMRKKIFYTAHYVRPHSYGPIVPRSVWDARHREACRMCDAVFALSERVRGQLSEFLGEGHPPILIAPHGVWTVDVSTKIPPLPNRLAEKRLLFFGTMRRDKGLDLVLEAMPKMPEYRLTIAGAPLEEDYFYNEIMPTVNRLRANGAKIDVIDRYISDDEVPALFAEHSAILLPYTQQFTAQSGVVFLALAHEIPVICSDAGGVEDLISGGRIGTTFHQRTVDSLVKAVGELFADDRTADLASQIHDAKGRLTWAAAARATLDGYSIALQSNTNKNEIKKKEMQTDDSLVATIS